MTIDLFYPSPEYDWVATERWLEKKARKGWRLVPGNNFPGLAAFERTAPAELRYRLVPTGKIGLTRADDDPPNAAALELYRQMGWEYVSNRGGFHIFRTEDPCAPEPDTDPQILAMALKPTAVRAVLDSLIWLLFIDLQFASVHVLETAIRRNNPIWILFPIPLAAAALARLASCIRLLRYRHICSKGRFPETRRRLYLPDNILLACCLTLVLTTFFGSSKPPTTPLKEVYDDYVFHEGYEWPFTIPGAQVKQTDAVSFRTFATRENWGYDGYIIMSDGSQDDIYIDYADFHSELLAKLYAWDVQRRHRWGLVLHQGTEVYEIRTNVTIENPESIFFPGKE